MYFDLAAMDPKPRYNLLTALILPRPIAWVTTSGIRGGLNAAPFSFFNVMSGTPPILCLGIDVRDGQPKDSARNIAETGEFVVNLVNHDSAVLMNATAIDFDRDVDELAEVGLATEPSTRVGPPRISASPVALECVRRKSVSVGSTCSIIIAEVLVAHVADEFVADVDRGHIDAFALDLIGRMQGNGWYTRTTDHFQIPRLTTNEWVLAKNRILEINPGVAQD